MKPKLYGRLLEAINKAMSKALDGDDMFDDENYDFEMIDKETEDTSIYANHSKYTYDLIDVIRNGFTFKGVDFNHDRGLEHNILIGNIAKLTKILYHYYELDDLALQLLKEHRIIEWFEEHESLSDIVAKYTRIRLYLHGFDGFEYTSGYNFMDENGKLLSEEWFDTASDFIEGNAAVRTKSGSNYIKEDGTYLSDTFYRHCYSFHEGFGTVANNDEHYNFIDKDGNLLFNEWFANFDHFREGFAAVQKYDRSWYIIDNKGRYLNNEPYQECHSFYGGLALVAKYTDASNDTIKYNYIDTKGKYLSNVWFSHAAIFNGVSKYAYVTTFDGKTFLIDRKGRLHDTKRRAKIQHDKI